MQNPEIREALIDYVEYPWRGKPKIFVYLNSEVVVMEVIDMDTEEE